MSNRFQFSVQMDFLSVCNILCFMSLRGSYKASQAEGHGFESRLPLNLRIKELQQNVAPFFVFVIFFG